jgi:hypothetical protein
LVRAQLLDYASQLVRAQLLDYAAQLVRAQLLDYAAQLVRAQLLDYAAQLVRAELLDYAAQLVRAELLDYVAQLVRGEQLDYVAQLVREPHRSPRAAGSILTRGIIQLLFSQLLLVEIFIYENPSTVSSIERDAQNIDIYQNLCSDTLGALILKTLVWCKLRIFNDKREQKCIATGVIKILSAMRI